MLTDLFTHIVVLSLSAAVIVLLVVILRLLLKKAPRGLVCLLWLLVAVRLLIPALPESNVSVVPQSVSEGSVLQEISAQPVEEVVRIHENEPEYSILLEQQPQLPVYRERVSAETYVEVSAATREAPKTFGNTVVPVLAVVWVTGIGLMLLYMAFSYFRVWRKVQASVREERNVWICDGISSPFILGMIRPRIYLPSTVNAEDRPFVLAHEQAHIRRLDHIWKPFGYLLLSVYWFNPLIWVAYVLLCRDIEMACDEKVIGSGAAELKKKYAEALLACSAKQRLVTACPLAFGEVGVKTRIRGVLNYRKPAFWILAAALVISIVAAVCALTDAPRQSTEQDPFSQDQTKEATAPESPVLSVQSFHEEDFTVFSWNRGGLQKTPTISPRAAVYLPDTQGTAKGKAEDVASEHQYYIAELDLTSEHQYYIAELDLTVDLPEGYYLYRVDGMYRDPEGNTVRMAFVDEYILALRKLTEEELVREICDFHTLYPEAYEEQPAWVLWNFKVVHKNYWPVEQLYTSALQMNGEVRQKGEYLVLSGMSVLWSKFARYSEAAQGLVEDDYRVPYFCKEYMTVSEKFPQGTASQEDEDAFVQALRTSFDWPVALYDDEWYVDTFRETILTATLSSGVMHYRYALADGYYDVSELLFAAGNPGPLLAYWNSYPDGSILSDDWWADYSTAVRELTQHPEKYTAPPVTIEIVDKTFEEGFRYPETQSEEWNAMRAEQALQRAGWYADSTQEITARAFVYAWMRAVGEDCPLEDIAIYLKPSANDARFFLAFRVDRSNGYALTPVYKGVDYLYLCDLDLARMYVEKYVK